MKNSVKKYFLCALGLAAGICLTGNLHAAQIQGITLAACPAQDSGQPEGDAIIGNNQYEPSHEVNSARNDY